MKRALVLMFLCMSVILSADKPVNIEIKNTDYNPIKIMIGGGIGWGTVSNTTADMYLFPNFYAPILGGTASIDFNTLLSYSGALKISVFTLLTNGFLTGGDIFTFFNPGKMENYLNIHLFDEESVRETEVVLYCENTGNVIFKDITKLTLPTREITSIRIGKELNYDFITGLNLNPLDGLSIGYDYTYYLDADLETDWFGEVKVHQYTKIAVDLYMTGRLDLSNPLTMFGIKAEWNSITDNTFGTHLAGGIHFIPNSMGGATLVYSAYCVLGGTVQQ